MEEIVSLPPMEFFNNDYQAVLDFIEDLGNPKFKIAGNLDLYMKHEIKTLGNLVEVEGYLDLEFTDIKELPENLKIGRFLNLYNTNITTLPNNLHVGGWLNLYNTNITTLPNNLHVGGWLDLSHTNITTLPNNLHVGDNLFIHKTPISSKFFDMTIRKTIIERGGYVGGEIFK